MGIKWLNTFWAPGFLIKSQGWGLDFFLSFHPLVLKSPLNKKEQRAECWFYKGEVIFWQSKHRASEGTASLSRACDLHLGMLGKHHLLRWPLVCCCLRVPVFHAAWVRIQQGFIVWVQNILTAGNLWPGVCYNLKRDTIECNWNLMKILAI